jgi:tetratricopeptide (TPR) repeat protein
MSLRLSFLLVTALILSACNNQAQDKDPTQADSDSNPNYKQAQQDLDNNNPAGAVADYEAALGANPKLAGAHYELGVIYGDKMNDPISSIYHFKRFLELSPNTDKKDQVQALIDKEGQDYAASLPNAKPQITQADLDKVNTDNAALKKQVDDANTTIAQLQGKLQQAQAAPSPGPAVAAAVTSDATAPETPAGPRKAIPVDQSVAAAGNADTDAAAQAASTSDGAPPAGARSYTVSKGDSYWKIAKKMYPGDTKNGVAKIQGANKQTMGKPLKIGQVLVIP